MGAEKVAEMTFFCPWNTCWKMNKWSENVRFVIKGRPMRSSDAIPSFDWGDIVVNLSVVRLTYCPLGPKTKTAKGGHMIQKKKNISQILKQLEATLRLIQWHW